MENLSNDLINKSGIESEEHLICELDGWKLFKIENGKKVVTEDDFYIGGAPLFSTMTIGDIIDVLPETIKTYSAKTDKEIYFYPRIYNTYISIWNYIIDDCIFYSTEDKLINSLFDCLVWCIKQKYIKL